MDHFLLISIYWNIGTRMSSRVFKARKNWTRTTSSWFRFTGAQAPEWVTRVFKIRKNWIRTTSSWFRFAGAQAPEWVREFLKYEKTELATYCSSQMNQHTHRNYSAQCVIELNHSDDLRLTISTPRPQTIPHVNPTPRTDLTGSSSLQSEAQVVAPPLRSVQGLQHNCDSRWRVTDRRKINSLNLFRRSRFPC